MTTENEKQSTSEHKIHKTHFPVIKISLKDSGKEGKFEWVDTGNGHWKRVPKQISKNLDTEFYGDKLHQMSPLIEKEPARESFTTQKENINHFFDDKIGSNEAWKWHMDVSNADIGNKIQFFASLGISFGVPLEADWKKDGENETTYYRVYGTNEKGLYLRISSKDVDAFRDPKTILDSVRDFTFYRYGSKLNQEYITSITNG